MEITTTFIGKGEVKGEGELAVGASAEQAASPLHRIVPNANVMAP